jgi:hypothetical protein
MRRFLDAFFSTLVTMTLIGIAAALLVAAFR